MNNPFETVLGLLAILLLFLLYWLPTITAYKRQHNDCMSILLVNFFFGWTFIGWIVAEIWAASGNVSEEQREIEYHRRFRGRRNNSEIDNHAPAGRRRIMKP